MHAGVLQSLPLSGSSVTGETRIAYTGDSTTSNAFIMPWHGVGTYAPSDAPSLTAGDGTIKIFSNGTAQWKAPGDDFGAATAVGGGLVWLESDSAGMGVCLNITDELVALVGTVGGYEITVTMEANTEYGLGGFAPASWGQAGSGWLFDVSSWSGIEGETTAGLLARLDSVFDRDSLGRPITRKPGIVCMLVGINDVAHITASDAGYSLNTTKSNLTALKDAILARGAQLIIGTICSEAPGATEWGLIQQINTHITSLQGRGVTVVDYASIIIDANETDGRAVSGYMEGLHYTTAGAIAASAPLSAALKAIAGGSTGASDFRAGGRSDNVMPDGRMIKTDGTLINTDNTTGSSALVVSVVSENGSCVCSKIANDGDYPAQQYAITGADLFDSITVMIPVESLTPGKTYYGQYEIDISGSGGAYIFFAALVVSDNNGTNLSFDFPKHELTSPQNITDFRGVFTTPDITIPSWAVSTNLYISAYLNAGDTTIKLRSAGVAERKL